MGRSGLPAFGGNKHFEGFSKISFLLFINFSDPSSISVFVVYFCQEEKVGFGIVVKTVKNVGEVFRLVVGDDNASTPKKRGQLLSWKEQSDKNGNSKSFLMKRARL